MMHCKKSHYINNGICLTDMQECVKENCNQWQPYTNYDRIRNMSVEELAVFIATLLRNHLTAYTKAIGFEPPTLTATEITKANKEWGKWLESEVTE